MKAAFGAVAIRRRGAFLELVLVMSLVSCSLGFVDDGMKVWRRNTNFWNVGNWEGLVDENCSKNIFSFPGWMDPSVVAFPSSFIGKQIILPVNGHFVFQPGLTTLSDSGTCQHGREVKFRRTTKQDWYDPNNWGSIRSSSSSSSSSSSDLFDKDNSAIPHVERVPCQFDSVKFPERSTFNLIIPQKVKIGKFFLGDQEQNYTDIAIMMTTKLGMLQFQKAPEVEFALTGTKCADTDDTCICDNYQPSPRQRICSLSQCRSEEDECHNPIMPHGFCCPICGYHIKIKHAGGLKLKPIQQMLEKMLEMGKLDNGVRFHVSRYHMNGAHAIIVPMKNNTDASTRMLSEILSRIRSEPQVVEVTLNGSWENIPSDVDKWATEGMNGGLITFIIILILSLLLGIACFVFYRAKGTYPPLSFSSVSNILPNMSMPNITMPNITMPSMQMPSINIPMPGRRGSTHAGGRTFGFARFTNERVSTVNIERGAGNLERGEQVDETINRVDGGDVQDKEKVTDASAQSGFTNVTYDIIGVTEGGSATDPGAWQSSLSDKEQLLVDVDEPSSSSATSGTVAAAAAALAEHRPRMIPGPAKPSRAHGKDPKDDDGIEMTDDTAAILKAEVKPKSAEE